MDTYTLVLVCIGAATVTRWLLKLIDKLEGRNNA